MTMIELREYAFNLIAASAGPPVCKICEGDTAVFDLVDFNKTCHVRRYPFGVARIPVVYYKCIDCEFIFTDFFDGFTGDQWTTYVYDEQYYVDVDPEYADVRPKNSALLFEAFLAGRKDAVIGLDYGGGNGRTTEYMRDAGWSYDCWDPFDRTDMTYGCEGKYNFCTSIEVFEHTPDPVGSLKTLVEKCTPDKLIVMIGTCVHDGVVTDETRLNWWYAAPRNGHISLYSRRSLKVLAAKFGLTYVSMSGKTHLLVRGHTKREMQAMLLRGKLRAKAHAVLRREA
jgi:2-polyprenyl-3-methyl-5-hydroxy-6-metoxy-1,4-benzoquinol methylase